MIWIVCASVFLVPLASLIVMSGTIVWYPQYLMTLALGFALASYLIWRENKPLAVLLFYCFLSYIFVCHQHPRSLLCLLSAYSGGALICLVSRVKSIKPIYISLITMAFLQFVLVIAQRLNLDPFFHLVGNDQASDVVGFIGSHNQLGSYYAGLTPLFVCFLPVALFMVGYVIILTKCSTAMLAMGVGLISYFCLIGNKIAIALLLSFVLLGAFYILKYDSSATFAFKERFSVWKLSISQVIKGIAKMKVSDKVTHLVTCNSWTGFGIGSFIMISPDTQENILQFSKSGNNNSFSRRYEHAHNDIIEWVFEGGYFGLILAGWLIIDILCNFISLPKTKMLIMSFSALIVQAVLSCGVYIIHAPVTYLMLCLMVGLFYWEVKNARISIQKA